MLAGTNDALLTTEVAPKPDRKTGLTPSEQQPARGQRIRPIRDELLRRKGLVCVVEDAIVVTSMKGPLEEGWQERVEAFVARIRDPAP
jgi:hypothetical protein